MSKLRQFNVLEMYCNLLGLCITIQSIDIHRLKQTNMQIVDCIDHPGG